MNLLQKAARLLKEGNDCEKCPCAWEEWGAEDYDGGCYAGRDLFEGTCRLPRFVRWYLARKAEFAKEHEYDGIEEWNEEDDRLQRVAEKALYKRCPGVIFCWEAKTLDCGNVLMRYDQEAIKHEICYDIRNAVEDAKREKAPHTLSGEWKALLKKTVDRAIFKIRSTLTI